MPGLPPTDARGVRLAGADWMTAPAARAVMHALSAAGGQARFVGGCVRNALIGRPIGDIDIATTLRPEAVQKAAARAGLKAVPTGLRHGTVTVVADHHAFEVTTLRVDVETDGRHAVVAFSDDWRADAARRDFTMNTLSATPDGAVFDYFGGVDDARAGRVRFVGDAATRIREDYLRILRFFRFHAQYGRPPADAAALAAIRDHAHGIAGLSGERLRQEMVKLLSVADPVPAIDLMAATAALEQVVPDTCLGRLAPLVAWETAAGQAPAPIRRLAALTAADAGVVADRLRLANAESERLRAIQAPSPPLPDRLAAPDLRGFAYRVGVTVAVDRLLLAHAAAGMPADPDRAAAIGELAGWRPPEFPVSGRDVVATGIGPGPEVGRTLAALEAWWVRQDFRPGRQDLLRKLNETLVQPASPRPS